MSLNNLDAASDKKSKRIWEIDFLRGLAIIGMIFIHLLFVLTTFYGIPIFKNETILYNIISVLQNYGGIIFILISGISSILSKNNFKRGSQLFIVAMLVTYVTTIFNYYIMNDHNNYIVRFGILHFLSVCMMLAPLFLKLKDRYLIPISIIIIIFGYYARNNGLDFPILYGYEIRPWFRSADYFPLLPYIGFFILGIVIGRRIYKDKKSLFKSDKIYNNFLIRTFCFFGKHTLIIYLAHQPIIFGALELFKYLGVI